MFFRSFYLLLDLGAMSPIIHLSYEIFRFPNIILSLMNFFDYLVYFCIALGTRITAFWIFEVTTRFHLGPIKVYVEV